MNLLDITALVRESNFQVKNIIINEEESVEGVDNFKLIIKCNVEEDCKQYYEKVKNNKSTLEKNEFFRYRFRDRYA